MPAWLDKVLGRDPLGEKKRKKAIDNRRFATQSAADKRESYIEETAAPYYGGYTPGVYPYPVPGADLDESKEVVPNVWEDSKDSPEDAPLAPAPEVEVVNPLPEPDPTPQWEDNGGSTTDSSDSFNNDSYSPGGDTYSTPDPTPSYDPPSYDPPSYDSPSSSDYGSSYDSGGGFSSSD